MKQKLLKLMCLLCVGMMSMSAWAQAYTTVTTFQSATVVTGAGYQEYSDDNWSISVGGNNVSVGFNKTAGNAKTIGDALGTGADKDYYGSVIKSKNKIDKVSQITFTYSGVGSGTTGKIYLAYSTDGTTWNAITLTSGTQGSSATSDMTFQFTEIASAYYGVILEKGSTTGVFRWDNVEITFDKVTPPSISFDITDINLEVGDTHTETATAVNMGSPTISYTSSDVSVATVNSSTGEVTAVAAGSATITASATYSATEYTATYDITVTKPVVAGMSFYESFDSNEGTGGNDDQWSGSIASSTFNSDNTWTVSNASGANKCAKFGTSSKKGSATTPSLGITGDAILTFKAAAWNGGSEETTLNLSASSGVTLDKSSVTLVKGKWTEYTVKATGLVAASTITFEASTASSNRFFLDEVKVAAIIGTVTVSASGYATYYNSEYDYKLPKGLTGFTAINPSAGKITLKPEYEAGDVVPAGEALVLKGTAGSYDLTYEASATSPIVANLLKGTDADATTTGADKYYKLSYDSEGNNLGFYWATAGGAAFTNGAHKAYLALTDAQAAGVKGFRLDYDEATAITELTEKAEATEGVIYNLQGQRVNSLQKGINIVNGKKVLVK